MQYPKTWQGQALVGGAVGIAAGLALYYMLKPEPQTTYKVPTLSAPPPPNVVFPKGGQGPTTPETLQLLQGGCSGAATQGFGFGAAMCPIDKNLGFPVDLAQREAYILNKVRNGEFFVEWVPIVADYNGHTAKLWVNADALKIDGVRVEVSATLQQQLCDVIPGGASMITPRIMDLMFSQAQVTLSPITRSAPPTDWVNNPPNNPGADMKTTPNMITQSLDIDRKLIAQLGSVEAASGKLVSTVGKAWTLSNKLPGKKASTGLQVAMNYGWNIWSSPTDALTPVTAIKNANGKTMRVLQDPGTRHDFSHMDYSQYAFFVLNDVILDGQAAKLTDILTNPDIAPMLSSEGALTVLRQPGVPVVAPLVTV
jgi:hypothetical protein